VHPTTLGALVNQRQLDLTHEADAARLASMAKVFRGTAAGGPRFEGLTLDIAIVALMIVGVFALVILG
jgi:hypothetical protein